MLKIKKTIIGKTESSAVTNDNNKIHVVLLYGGMGKEREVSLMSYPIIKEAILQLGYKVTPVDMGQDVYNVMIDLAPDVVFIGMYGTHGEDGHIQALLNILGIKYTHSSMLASLSGFNKKMSYALFNLHGINTPKSMIITGSEAREKYHDEEPIARPYVIKPNNEGSSVGVEIVFAADDYHFSQYPWEDEKEYLVEPYIKGREINVTVIEGKAIGTVEVTPLKKRFYDYESKYTDGMTLHQVPAPLDEDEEKFMMNIAEKAHKIIGADILSRADFIYNPDEKHMEHMGVYLIEVNTHPGLTRLSLVPEACLSKGISFEQIIDKLIKNGLSKRYTA